MPAKANTSPPVTAMQWKVIPNNVKLLPFYIAAPPRAGSKMSLVICDLLTTYNYKQFTDEERWAIAHLIAAAPELLAALKMIVENAEDDGYVNAGLLTDALNAIEKAEEGQA